MLAGDLIYDAAFEFGDQILYDGSWVITQDGSRLTEARWMKFIHDALRTLVLVRPDSYTATVAHLLTGGNTRQSMPAGAIRLIDITRNMGGDGLTPGYTITPIDRKEMDDSNFTWHSDDPSSFIDHYTYELSDPLHFFVTPKPSTTPSVYIEMVYSLLPAFPAVADDPILVSDVFWQPLLHWMLYKAYSIDDEAVNVEMAIHHHNGFYQSVGQEIQAGTLVNPTNKE